MGGFGRIGTLAYEEEMMMEEIRLPSLEIDDDVLHLYAMLCL